MKRYSYSSQLLVATALLCLLSSVTVDTAEARRKSMFYHGQSEEPQYLLRKSKGYLKELGPVEMRFSDDISINKRPPSPALPEFSVLSNQYLPYLLETPLSDDMLSDRERLSEVVIELGPHSIVSGAIDTTVESQAKVVDRLDLEEDRATVLRPEEVLIFFENSGDTTEVKKIIPFSPAQQSEGAIRSSATYEKE